MKVTKRINGSMASIRERGYVVCGGHGICYSGGGNSLYVGCRGLMVGGCQGGFF